MLSVARPAKDVGVQSLRGIAIILMVAGHVIGSDASRGIQVGDDTLWRYFYQGLEDLRMPLFTVLSGFVYGYRPVRQRADVRALIRGKTRRLLVPLLVVGAALFIVKLLVPDVNTRPEPGDFWRVYVFPYEHLWFLQSIFTIFLVVGLLDAFGAIRTRLQWGIALIVSCVLFVLITVPASENVFSAKGTLRLLPFFLLGYGMKRYAHAFTDRRVLVGVVVALAVTYSLRLHNIVTDADDDWTSPARRALSLAVGVLGVTVLFAARRFFVARALVWLGGFSYGIYLLHVFGSAGARIALGDAVDSSIAMFTFSLVAGLALPVVFELVLGRYGAVSWSVLGQKPRASSSSTAATSTRAGERVPEVDRLGTP